MPSKVPWLAPLAVSSDMKKRLDRAWAELSVSLGTPISKAMFVRMLLERGMQSIEASPTALAFDEGRKQATRKKQVGTHRKAAQ